MEASQWEVDPAWDWNAGQAVNPNRLFIGTGRWVNKVNRLNTFNRIYLYLYVLLNLCIKYSKGLIWFQHNQPFPWGSEGNLTVPGEILSMSNITRAYSGEYVCNADNGVGRYPVRESITLDVLCKYLCYYFIFPFTFSCFIKWFLIIDKS